MFYRAAAIYSCQCGQLKYWDECITSNCRRKKNE